MQYGTEECTNLKHEGEEDVVRALPLPQQVQVRGQRRVRVHTLDLHVPLVQAVVHQLHLTQTNYFHFTL